MGQKYCYLVDSENKPLKPTHKWNFVYKQLKSGKAKVIRKLPFVVKLLDKKVEKVGGCTLCIDPGKTTGLCVVERETGKVLFKAELLINLEQFSERLRIRKLRRKKRRVYSRRRKIRRAKKAGTYFNETRYFKYPGQKKSFPSKYIKPKVCRVLNYKGKLGKMIYPSTEFFTQSFIKVINDLFHFLPIDEVLIEYGKFEKERIQRKNTALDQAEKFKEKGLPSRKILSRAKERKLYEIVKKRDLNRCVVCNSQERLEVHHVKPFAKVGRNLLEEMVLLCRNCHVKLHNSGSKEIEEKIIEYLNSVKFDYSKYKYHYNSKINIRYALKINFLIPRLVSYLKVKYGAKVEIIPPYEIANLREGLKLEKSHILDAYLLYFYKYLRNKPGVKIPRQIKKEIFKIIPVPRHHRTFTLPKIKHRLYKDQHNNKVIAKNRTRFLTQKEPSLKDLNLTRKEISKLKVEKGNPIYLIQNKTFLKYRFHPVLYFNHYGKPKEGIIVGYKQQDKIKVLTSGKIEVIPEANIIEIYDRKKKLIYYLEEDSQ